jgi:hypothetical protein
LVRAGRGENVVVLLAGELNAWQLQSSDASKRYDGAVFIVRRSKNTMDVVYVVL